MPSYGYRCATCETWIDVRAYSRRQAESKVAWMMEEVPDCKDCRQEKELNEAREFAAALDLPPLTGTTAQIAYAEALRALRLRQIHDVLPPDDGVIDHDLRQVARHSPALFSDALDAMSSIAAAKWWIDNKHDRTEVLMSHLMTAFVKPKVLEDVAETVTFESTLRPATAVTETPVRIVTWAHADLSSVRLDLPERRDDFGTLVKSYGYWWDSHHKHWVRHVALDDPHGGLVRVAAEIGRALLAEGFVVQCLDMDVMAGIRDGAEPEIRKRIDYVGSGLVSVDWKRVDGDYYEMVKRIAGARWRKSRRFVTVPVTSADGLRDFAEAADFVITDRAAAAFAAFDAFRATGAVVDVPKIGKATGKATFELDREAFPETFSVSAALVDDEFEDRWSESA